MRAVGIAILLGLGGTIAAAIYTFVIGLAGAPGALLSAAAAKRSPDGKTPAWGLFLTVAGQTYMSLAFVALVINFTDARLFDVSGAGKWLVWCVAFFVAMAPISIALKDSAGTPAADRTVQHHATTITVPLTTIGFFLFVLLHRVLDAGWGWVPAI